MNGRFPYIDDMFRTGSVRGPASMHLSYRDPADDIPRWDESAADRPRTLDDLVLSDAMLADGQRVLDVGCGLGGTLDAIAQHYDAMDLIGVNIDHRQLAGCAEMVARNTSTLRWVCGDAVSLPFADDSMDRVLSVEAAPHFSSRKSFLAEAARVLKPRGRLAGTDISLALPPDASAATRRGALAAVHTAIGTWPDPFASLERVYASADLLGFRTVRFDDITAATANSYREFSPPTSPFEAALAHLRSMHQAGELRCVRFALEAGR